MLLTSPEHHAFTVLYSSEHHQFPEEPRPPEAPAVEQLPPGKAVSPVEFVDPVFGVSQCVVPASLINPPAILAPPKKSPKAFQSAVVDMCHPVGANFFRKEVSVFEASFQMPAIAYQLYNLPYTIPLLVWKL